MSVESLLQAFLAFVVMPAWLLAGFTDYLCHRRTSIETTSGWRESALHALQLVQVGLPTLAVLFLDVDAAVLLFMAATLVAHQATAAWDVRYANATRVVSPLEQHVHGVLEMAPIIAAALVAILNWDEVDAALRGAPRFALAWREPALPLAFQLVLLAGAALLGVVPYAEELWRTARGRRR